MITFQSVHKTFASAVAVNRVFLEINRGECLALLGPNGAGKTTLVKILLGLVRPDSGTVTINGIPANVPASRAATGYLEEQQRIPPHLSGRQYLSRSAALLGLDGGEARQDIDRVLELCSMTREANGMASGYSKGMRQRIGLAAALLGRPQLLVLDEPTSGLDPFGIREMRLLLDRMHRDGVTIVINSHLISEVEKICDSAAFMQQGRIVLKDSLSNLLANGDETLEDVFMRHVEKRDA
jgi:ABC-2 type transport system ATP-binding protein